MGELGVESRAVAADGADLERVAGDIEAVDRRIAVSDVRRGDDQIALTNASDEETAVVSDHERGGLCALPTRFEEER